MQVLQNRWDGTFSDSSYLMDMDFAVSCPFVKRSRLKSDACTSAHALLHASFRPRLGDDALALR
jgi:hypothetical protein